MQNKSIYDEWKLHLDATQLEINYKFLIKFIDILDTDALTDPQSTTHAIITDSGVLRDWKLSQIDVLLHQFAEISTTAFPSSECFNHPKLFIRSIFRAGFILNALKVTNYKASELHPYYEPKLFLFAQKYLNLTTLEEWISMLSDRIFANDHSQTADQSQRQCTWALTLQHKSLKNVVWHVENLLLNFKDITSWFNRVIPEVQAQPAKNAIALNIMNHMIVYGLTDFYAKYYTEILNASYMSIYPIVLKEITIDVFSRTFAIVSFKQLALFLNYLLTQNIIDKNDTMVHNYQQFIKICCSQKNVNLLRDILYNQVDLSNIAPSAKIVQDAISPANKANSAGDFAQTFTKQTTAYIEPDENDIPVVPYKTKNIASQESDDSQLSAFSDIEEPLPPLNNKFTKPKFNSINELDKNHMSKPPKQNTDDTQLNIDFSQKEVDEYE